MDLKRIYPFEILRLMQCLVASSPFLADNVTKPLSVWAFHLASHADS